MVAADFFTLEVRSRRGLQRFMVLFLIFGGDEIPVRTKA
jgi:hypothetical protein